MRCRGCRKSKLNAQTSRSSLCGRTRGQWSSPKLRHAEQKSPTHLKIVNVQTPGWATPGKFRRRLACRNQLVPTLPVR